MSLPHPEPGPLARQIVAALRRGHDQQAAAFLDAALARWLDLCLRSRADQAAAFIDEFEPLWQLVETQPPPQLSARDAVLEQARSFLGLLHTGRRLADQARVEDAQRLGASERCALLALLDLPPDQSARVGELYDRARTHGFDRSRARLSQVLVLLFRADLVEQTVGTARGGRAYYYHLTSRGRALARSLLPQGAPSDNVVERVSTGKEAADAWANKVHLRKAHNR